MTAVKRHDDGEIVTVMHESRREGWREVCMLKETGNRAASLDRDGMQGFDGPTTSPGQGLTLAVGDTQTQDVSHVLCKA